MGRLLVRLRGKPINELTLSPDRSYIVGRKEDCDFVLKPEKGISREHFKITYVNNVWMLEVVSRYGEVISEGQKIQSLALQHGIQFSVPPYEFEYSESQLNSVSSPEVSPSQLPVAAQTHELENFGGSHEKTVVGFAPLSAFIKILDNQNEAKEIFRLDSGDSWTAGRDPSCHIQIRDQRVSRNQFEIRRQGSNYVILDLESVNGTLLNGSPISSEPVLLKSGDVIAVLTNNLCFELHDASYSQRLEMVRANPPQLPVLQSTPPSPAVYPMSTPSEMVPYQSPDQMVMYNPTLPPQALEPPPKKFDFNKNRLIIYGIVFLALVYLFMGDNKEETTAQPAAQLVAPGSPQDIFNKLSPEQQELVRRRYKDAKNFYMQGKYQLAQEEIIKIQAIVPDYEDIKDIEQLSKQAIYLQEQQLQQDQKLKQAKEIEDKINAQAELCSKKLNPQITREEIDSCLSLVMEFNPTHPKIVDLQNQVDAITSQREAKAAEKAAYQAQVAQLRAIYSKALSVQKDGKPLDAIAAFERVIRSSLPDPNGLKEESRRNIASLRQQMSSKTSALQAEAEKFYQSQKLKDAILILRKARVIDPENPEIPERIDNYTMELKKAMMRLYQEGILEESFGNIEGEGQNTAKKKWEKITQDDIPDGEYYKKALIKLKKYGVK